MISARRQLLLVTLMLVAARSAAAQQYSVTDIGPLGFSGSARAINTQGQVVGFWSEDNETHPFIWTDGAMQDLGLLPGASHCVAQAINDSSEVAGSCWGAAYAGKAFVWTADTGMQELPIPGYADVSGINSLGHVAGEWTAGGYPHAFVYRDGALEDLGPGRASAINDQDQVAGFCFELATVCMWDADGTHIIDTADLSEAFAINADGVIAGRAANIAALWTPYGRSNLGTLPGGTVSGAFAISGDLVVGGSAYPYGAFLYDTNGPGYPIDLNDLIPPNSGWALTVAFGVNSVGQIVGIGEIDGQSHAFLLTPIDNGTGAAIPRR